MYMYKKTLYKYVIVKITRLHLHDCCCVPCREVLQSTVETLHAALSGSLELAAIVDSVLAGQPVQGEGQLRDEGLSEEYLTPRKGTV